MNKQNRYYLKQKVKLKNILKKVYQKHNKDKIKKNKKN